MTLVQLFQKSVAACSSLPAWIVEFQVSESDLRRHTFDKSYLDFLDEQITLSPRGPEWTQRLIQRKESLARHCDKELVVCSLGHGSDIATIEIDPATENVVYWEIYQDIKIQA